MSLGAIFRTRIDKAVGKPVVVPGLSRLCWIACLLMVSSLAIAGAQSRAESTHSHGKQLLLESVHILGGHRRPVARWYDPVRVALIGSISESLSLAINSIFNEVSLLSGIPYRLIQHDVESTDAYAAALSQSAAYDLSVCESSDGNQCANFVIVLADKVAMHKIAVALPLRPVFQKATRASDPDLLCFFSPGVVQATEIVRSVVYVQSDIDIAMQLTCLQEEIYQSFGLFDDFSDSQYFSFNNEVREKQITVYDKQLLSSLYDNAFVRGTAALPVAQQLVDYCGTRC